MRANKTEHGALPAQRRLTLDIEKRMPGFRLAAQLAVEAEIMVLFGPSGAGKTTTLKSIAGLAAPDCGEIKLNGRVLFFRKPHSRTLDVPARHRGIGYVFQNLALFPHLNVRQNVAYPLGTSRRPWGMRRDERRAIELLEQMHLAHLSDRLPGELSGGQQQRVAIARALAAEPRLLLLDEPFSALDAAVRERLQADLAALQSELAIPILYVTHRLEDAFAIGQRLAVMKEGQIIQVGPIADVCHRPAGHDIAEIIGIRNLFRARVIETTSGGLVLDWNGLYLEAPAPPEGLDGGVGSFPAPGASVAAYIRPEEVKILYPDRPVTTAVLHNRIEGVIREVRLGAEYRQIQAALPNGAEVEVRFPPSAYSSLRLRPGDGVVLSLRRKALVVLPDRSRMTTGGAESAERQGRYAPS